jgi:hypothetical protein
MAMEYGMMCKEMVVEYFHVLPVIRLEGLEEAVQILSG